MHQGSALAPPFPSHPGEEGEKKRLAVHAETWFQIFDAVHSYPRVEPYPVPYLNYHIIASSPIHDRVGCKRQGEVGLVLKYVHLQTAAVAAAVARYPVCKHLSRRRQLPLTWNKKQ